MANIDADAVKQAVSATRFYRRPEGADEQQRGRRKRHYAAGARKGIQQENGDLPLMVHIGNNPPNLDEIAELLSSGDIITHCYNGKPNRILTPPASCAARLPARCSAACA
jgi:dihydroorotase